MSEAKPTIMTAVPRFYQNLFNKINANFNKQKGFKKKLIDLTLELGKKKMKKIKLKYHEIIIPQVVAKDPITKSPTIGKPAFLIEVIFTFSNK